MYYSGSQEAGLVQDKHSYSENKQHTSVKVSLKIKLCDCWRYIKEW